MADGAAWLESALARRTADPLPVDRHGVAGTACVLRRLALRPAGRCGPCLNGLPRIAAALRALAAPGPQGTVRAAPARRSDLVEGRDGTEVGAGRWR
ncbi:hypothetical protein [Streptomyces maremycinicus]|uniref:hypothetical protein n=1 Tax=Streptomyces maremycinicus TaxID=1679753 RepID=UPI00078831D4|nr:hypothetical protein [Streptomyces sp. NBRC 110468]